MHELISRIPPGLVEIERVFLCNVVSLYESLVVQSPKAVVFGRVHTIKAYRVALIPVGYRNVEQLPLCCECQLREVLDCSNLSFVEPHHILNVMTRVVSSRGGGHEVIRVATLSTAATVLGIAEYLALVRYHVLYAGI